MEVAKKESVNRYANGKIYKIISANTDKIYIGSTCVPKLAIRLARHVIEYKRWRSGNPKAKYTNSFQILAMENYKIVLLEEVSCTQKDYLLMREQYWIDSSSNCVNTLNCYNKNQYLKFSKITPCLFNSSNIFDT